MKKLFSAILVLVMVTSLCGCGREVHPDLLKAAEHMEDLQSLSYRMEISAEGEKDGMDVPFSVTATNRILDSEGLMHMDMDMLLMDRHVFMTIYKQQEGFRGIEYKGIDQGSGMEWTKEEGKVLSILSAVPSENILQYLSEVENTGETEVIGGRTCSRYSAVIKGPGIKMLLKLISLMGEKGKELSAKISSETENLFVPVDLYLDTREPLIVKVRLEAADFLKAAGILDAQDTVCHSVGFSMEYGDFNAVEPIVIPQEALNAPLKGGE